MTTRTTSAFQLPDHLAAKADPDLIAADEQHFARIGARLDEQRSELASRLRDVRGAPGGKGQAAMDRDIEIHRLTGRLAVLRRFGLDICLGRVVAVGGDPVYIGRVGLTDAVGDQLLVDWRAPAAEPFFAATHADPMGLATRRRYRWSGGTVRDYWDEVLSPDGLDAHAALDDQSAFIASLGSSRSARMRDVLGTIQADQHAIVRAGSRGALVVDGGPGTGKTVVALHRTAHLLYAEPRLARRGGVLFVGPHEPYLRYVEDVLPSLGEEGVRTCTLRDLVSEGASAGVEHDPRVAALKASDALAGAIESAVRMYEMPPRHAQSVETPWAELLLDARDWAEAFAAVEPGVPHNEGREQAWDALVEIIVDQHDPEEVPAEHVRRVLQQDDELRTVFDRAWPLLEPTDIVAGLWSVPAFLRHCAPMLLEEEVALLQRAEPRAWTVADLPIIDAARSRIGDPHAARHRRREHAAIAADRAYMDRVVDDILDADVDGEGFVQMLRVDDLRTTLVHEDELPRTDPEVFAGPFAHVVVDEAQELTDAEWRMLLRRCPSRSLTIVGDRAQARHGFTESWRTRLERIGLRDVALAALTINYRTPSEVMDAAEPVIRAAVPDANVPTSIRSSGIPVQHGDTGELGAVLDAWLEAHPDGIACVIGDAALEPRERVRHLAPELAKGLEFDLVVLVEPDRMGDGVQGAVDQYVAMTRATQHLVILRGTAPDDEAPAEGWG